MSTKGASNWYGNARGGRHGHETAHTGFKWAVAFNKSTLANHYNKHGKSMGFQDKYSYEAHAVRFANTIDRKNCISFKDSKGSTYKYNVKTNELAIITKKGIVITYFKPKEGKKYYDSQKRSKGKHGK